MSEPNLTNLITFEDEIVSANLAKVTEPSSSANVALIEPSWLITSVSVPLFNTEKPPFVDVNFDLCAICLSFYQGFYAWVKGSNLSSIS